MTISSDVHTGLRFKVSLTFEGSLGDMAFSKVSGLETESEVIEYREGNDPFTMRKIPGMTKYPPIVLERGVSNDSTLLLWRQAVAGVGNASLGATANIPELNPDSEIARAASAFTITLLNSEDKAVRTWTIVGGWPSKLTYGDLDASSNEILIETLEIVHDGMIVTGPKV